MKAFRASWPQSGVLGAANAVDGSSPIDHADADRGRTLELGEVYREHAATVARFVARLAGPTADLEDLVHEVFLVAGKKLATYRGDGKLTTWLFGITHNVVRQHRKRAWIRRWFAGAPAEVLEHVSEGATPFEELEKKQATAIVYRVLDSMNEKYRTVFILFELEGLSGQEIAEITGTKLGSVWVQLHRARAMFEERILREGGLR